MRILIPLAAALGLAACASTETAPSAPPSFAITPGQAPPAQARLYVDCIAQATSAQRYDREGNVLRFHCDGVVAQRFYEGLAAWVTNGGAQYEAEGATWRFSTPMQSDPSFLDFCRAWPDGRHDCTVVLNVGEFLEQ